jgi:uncharacterized protein (UPF0332 family)
MAFSWSAYLELATELSQRKESEAALRSAVSRAYYAVFHLAQLKLRLRSVSLDDTLGPHERVWKPFIIHADEKCKAIGVMGDRLKRGRKSADYENPVRNVPAFTTQAMGWSKIVFEKLQSLPPTLP